MTWLQGGPFLEISFLLTLDADRQTLIEFVLNRLKSFSPTVEIVATDKDVKEKIKQFYKGYRDNENEQNSIVYHSTQIPIYMDIDGKRKSILAIEQISSRLIKVSFWFFGSEWDMPEWNQTGITEKQIPNFEKVLHNLFDTFRFVIGTIGYEVSVTDLFDTNDGWPSEKYNLTNFRSQECISENFFITIIANKEFLDISDFGPIITTGQKQVLELKKTTHNKG